MDESPDKRSRIQGGRSKMTHDKTKLSVVIVNYDTWPKVVTQVDVLARTPEFAEGAAEAIVVDNDSPSGRPSHRPHGRGITWVDRHENGGFACGVNEGWRRSRGGWILLLNPDVVIGENLVGQVLVLLDEIDKSRNVTAGDPVGIVGIALTNPDGSQQPSVGAFPSVGRGLLELFLPRSRRRYQIVSPRKFSRVDWVTGAFFLVRAEVMNQLGGFDEDYFLYFEETDFCLRARRAGWGTYFDPSLSVCHENPLQNRPVSPNIRLLTRHSRLLYFRKNTSRYQYRVMMSMVRFEAELRCLLCRFRVRPQESKVWMAVRDLVREFRRGQEPCATAALRWVNARLADKS